MKIQIKGFKGMVPALSDHLLPVANAKMLINGKISKGDLRAFRSPLYEDAVDETTVQTILQYAENGNVNWVDFAEDVDHVLSPLTGESYERLYFTGLSEPRVFANDLVSGTFDKDTDYYKLGVPAPSGKIGTILNPTGCCTDPADDQNNTTGWTSDLGAVLSSVAGGVLGYRLEIAAGVLGGAAYFNNVSVTAGKKYRLHARMAADNGESYSWQIAYLTQAETEYDSGLIAGSGTGSFDEIEYEFTAQYTDANVWIRFFVTASSDGYVDNVTFYEMDTTDDAFTIEQTVRATGTADTNTTNHLIDTASGDFVNDGVVAGDIAYNKTDNTYATVTNVTATDLTLDDDAFPDGNEEYEITSNYGSGSLYRAYLFIYVTKYGEKGAASGNTVSITDYGLGSVKLTEMWDHAPDDRQIDKIYLYRTSASGAGVATFRFVLEADFFDISVSYAVGEYVIYLGELYKCTTTHSAGEWDSTHFTSGDDVSDDDLATDTLESEEWDPPPAGLKGLVLLPNGIAAGFLGNDVYLSEPYQIHAYPAANIVSIPQTIIGLGTYGNNIVVATNGEPYIISGLTPSQMYAKKGKGKFPCLSKRGIVSSQFGVQFPVKEGILRINESGTYVDTAGKIDPLDWEDYYPDTISAMMFSGKYFGCYEDDDGVFHGFFIDYGTEDLTLISDEVYCFYVSEEDGELYMAMNDEYDETNPPTSKPLCIKKWEGDQYNYLYYQFKTKRFVIPFEVNFAAARIMFNEEFYSDIVAAIEDAGYLATQNATIFAGDILGAINDNVINELDVHGDLLYDLSGVETNAEIVFRVYADDVLKFTKNVSNGKPFRLNSGYKSKRYEFQIEGNIPVKQMDVATSVEELMQ